MSKPTRIAGSACTLSFSEQRLCVCSPGPDMGHAHSELSRASSQLLPILMNRTQQKLEVALEFLDIEKGISCQKKNAFSQVTGVRRYPPKEKGSCKHGSSRREAIHECQTSSNSLTFWPWPHTFAPTWRDGGSGGRWDGVLEWQQDGEVEDAHLTQSCQPMAAPTGEEGQFYLKSGLEFGL